MRRMAVVLAVVLGVVPMGARRVAASTPAVDASEGIGAGFAGEWRYVSRLLLSLAEAIPAEKYGWRPAPGVRSVSETMMHVALTNYVLLAATGQPVPPGLDPTMERTVVAKPEVIGYLRRSLEAVATARAGLKPGELMRKETFLGRVVDVDGLYLRMVTHANEHLGQLIAYARMNGVVPPWSRPAGSAGAR